MSKVTRTLKHVSLDWLKPYANNPRIIEDAVPVVTESIKQVGYITPIVTDEDGVILAGHTRCAALKEIGCKECDVIVISGATEEQKKKYRLLDNKTGEIAAWDYALLDEELRDIDFGGFDFGQPDTSIFDKAVQKVEKKRTVICPRCGAEVEA